MSHPKPTPEASERRRAPRQRAFLRAKVSHLDGSISFTCSVTQISETGVRIAVTKEINIPECVRLEIPQKRIECEARVVRRDAESAGLAFEAQAEQKETGVAAMAERIRFLEAQNKMLKATCEALTAQIENNKNLY